MYDVAVVGAGPAGAVCAQQLSSMGLSVLLLEKGPKPYEKPCGGSVNFHTWQSLGYEPEQIDKIARKCGGREVRGVRLFSPSLKYHSVTVPLQSRFSFSVLRDKFDYLLFSKARKSSNVVTKVESVESIDSSSNPVIVTTNKSEYSCKYVVGADGVNSVVARSTGLREKWPEGSLAVLLRCLVKKVKSEIPPIKEFYLKETGYAWVFPKLDSVNIGIGQVGRSKAIRAEWDAFLKIIERYSLFKFEGIPKPDPWCLPITGPDWGNISRGNTLLIGDAGGFVFSSNGEGLYLAVESAKFAASAIKESIKTKKPVAELYRTLCVNTLKPQIDYSIKIMRSLASHPETIEDLVKFSASVPDFRDRIVENMFFSGDMSKIVKLPLKVKIALLAAKYLV